MLGGATGEGGRPGPGRPDFGKYPRSHPDPVQILSRSHPDPAVNPISFTKIDHFALLAKEMSTMGTILKEMAVFLK